MSESQFEEFDGCLILPREVISEVMLAEVGGVAVNNCTGFGEQSWDTEVTASNIARWQTTIDNCPVRPQGYCNGCDLQATLNDLKAAFNSRQE